MKIGIVYPQVELGGDPAAIPAIATAIETGGFDHLVAYDHILGVEHADRSPALSGRYTEDDPFHEPMVLFAYLAGLTARLEFTAGVMVLPQRQTALVAKQAAGVTLLSGGRLRLGVGVGWNHVEYRALGQDFATRGQRLEEQVPLLRRLWQERLVTFTGQFDQVDRAGLLPRPAQPIPLWFGGASERALERSARLGDGHIFSGPFERSAESWMQLRTIVRGANRHLDQFGGEVILRGLRQPHAIAARIEQWAARGGTHVSISTMGHGLDSTEAHVDFIGQLAGALRG